MSIWPWTWLSDVQIPAEIRTPETRQRGNRHHVWTNDTIFEIRRDLKIFQEFFAAMLFTTFQMLVVELEPVWPDDEIKNSTTFSKSCPKIRHSWILLKKLCFSKSHNTFGYFWKKICNQELLKIDQSDHTDWSTRPSPSGTGPSNERRNRLVRFSVKTWKLSLLQRSISWWYTRRNEVRLSSVVIVLKLPLVLKQRCDSA